MLLTRLLTTLLCGLLFCGTLSAQKPATAASNPAFEQLQTLAGTWEGKRSADLTTTLTYEIVSNGSVIMERLKPAKEPEMITMYSVNAGRLVVTHYCSAGNQPTLETAPLTAATGKYDFHFVRVMGMKTPNEGHMVDLVLTLTDKDHLTQAWSFIDHGKVSTETFSFSRKL